MHIAVPDAMGAAAQRWAASRGIPSLCSHHTRWASYLDYYPLLPTTVFSNLAWCAPAQPSQPLSPSREASLRCELPQPPANKRPSAAGGTSRASTVGAPRRCRPRSPSRESSRRTACRESSCGRAASTPRSSHPEGAGQHSRRLRGRRASSALPRAEALASLPKAPASPPRPFLTRLRAAVQPRLVPPALPWCSWWRGCVGRRDCANSRRWCASWRRRAGRRASPCPACSR